MPLSRRQILSGLAAWPLLRASASNRVTLGFIGVGARAQEILQAALLLPNTEIVGIVDAYKGRIERASERTGGRPKVYADYRELLATDAVDAVVIATPDHWHARIVTDVLKAGKDVYCEKPLTYRAGEGSALIRTVQETGRILQVGSQGMSSPIQQKAKEIIRSGKLGQITMIRAAYNRNTPSGAWIYPIPPDANPGTVNWDMFLGPAPHVPFSLERFFRWRCYWDYSGGIATDLFVHLCTTIHYLMDAKMPSRAVALGELYRWKESRNVPDTVNGVLEYPEGFAVNLSSTLNNETSPQASFQILGKGGTLSIGEALTFSPENVHEDVQWVVDSWPRELEQAYLQGEASHKGQQQQLITGTEQFRQEGNDATVAHLAHFIDSVRSRRPYWQDAAQGHHAAACAHMINEAVKRRRMVSWDFTKDNISDS